MSNPRAFPSAAIDDKFGGMTKLEWFAGMALSGLLANSDWLNKVARYEGSKVELIAAAAFENATAMIEEGKKHV
jgi:hypothetical protein